MEVILFMVYAEILAGGSGTRLGKTEMPKQFLNLGNKPIIIHTIEQFVLNIRIEKIIVCVSPEWVPYTNDIIKKYIGEVPKLFVTEAKSTRNDSVMSDCEYIKNNFGLSNKDVIIIHDAARPFISQRIIDDNISAVLENDAVDTVISAYDTIVESDDGKFIKNIPIRGNFYRGQTPQSFKIQKLQALYEKLTPDEREILTDTCKIFTLNGEKVNLVKGESYNMKITTLHDLKLADALITLGDNND